MGKPRPANVANDAVGRLRDPAVMPQQSTGLCGPLSILFELARRNPAEYVRATSELFDEAVYTTPTGREIVASG